ncbi:hypothetical protein CRN61_00900 [Vibrio vulnificus]|nr:hypothetical protein CRN61_00900 [Vibrio vulnificus]
MISLQPSVAVTSVTLTSFELTFLTVHAHFLKVVNMQAVDEGSAKTSSSPQPVFCITAGQQGIC